MKATSLRQRVGRFVRAALGQAPNPESTALAAMVDELAQYTAAEATALAAAVSSGDAPRARQVLEETRTRIHRDGAAAWWARAGEVLGPPSLARYRELVGRGLGRFASPGTAPLSAAEDVELARLRAQLERAGVWRGGRS